MKPMRTEPIGYEIRVAGHLPRQWADWFDGMTITVEAGGITVITGLLIDQAALHGLLKKIRDLGLPLVSVVQIKTNNFQTEHFQGE